MEKTKRTTAVGRRNDEKTVATSNTFNPGMRAATGTNLNSRPPSEEFSAIVDMMRRPQGHGLQPTYETILPETTRQSLSEATNAEPSARDSWVVNQQRHVGLECRRHLEKQDSDAVGR